jgi:hypothetical protein
MQAISSIICGQAMIVFPAEQSNRLLHPFPPHHPAAHEIRCSAHQLTIS